ncbi:MAG: DegT/DnrJ/EryC1/StrS family aminotransferase [Tissierellia bacterium]|nr:DegT/DnrJ/EryC1/StrS family aminotransferase [Tissierellia bacterium]
MKIQLIDLKRQYESIREEADKDILEVLHSARYIMGENILSFEKEFADYIGIRNAISCGNGTDALVLALEALGIGEGDEVITTPFTFFATAESISYTGAKPVFVDVELDSYNIDPSKIEEKINDKTKAIMPVHIFGQCAKMDQIMAIAKKHDLFVIEDVAQAAGAEYKGKKAGSFGDISTFSFFPTKNLGCAGDGGMMVTNSDDIAVVLRALRAHGSGENGQRAYNFLNRIEGEIEEEKGGDNTVYNPLKYYNYLIGHNSRLDELQAALLRVKLKHLDKWNEKRAEIAAKYNERILSKDLIKPSVSDDCKHIYHLYILQSSNRADTVEKLNSEGIATGIYYPIPMHLQKVYEELGYSRGDLPNAEYLADRTFAIPMFAELTDEEISHIINALEK